tara:strand:- start:3718 stop:3915 length:198 start_codon:yes stop_codon:yes gene_type:complete
MTCKKPCEDCKCTPCGHLAIDEDLYVEIEDGTFAFLDLTISEIEQLREQKRSIAAYAQENFKKKN